MKALKALARAQRPVIIYGAGVRLAGAMLEARAFSKRLGIPVAPTWGALDMFASDDPLTIGAFGTHGTRYGNFAVQNADWILAVGSRLDTKATGTPVESFAPDARVFMVDIDPTEIDKFGARVTGECADARAWLRSALCADSGSDACFSEWLERIHYWKARYPVCTPENALEEAVNPYVLIRALSTLCEPGEVVCADTGCAVAWLAQAFSWKSGQRFIHAFNQTPMGYGLPAAIGAYYATGKRVVLVTGDGSLMMSAGELATVAGHKLPIKIVLLNNLGHAMCRQTQREWFGGVYPSTSIEGGLSFPDFHQLARAHGIRASTMTNQRDPWTQAQLVDLLEGDDPALLQVMINPDHDVIPKVKYGHANEDMYPLLDRAELRANMFEETRAA